VETAPSWGTTWKISRRPQLLDLEAGQPQDRRKGQGQSLPALYSLALHGAVGLPKQILKSNQWLEQHYRPV